MTIHIHGLLVEKTSDTTFAVNDAENRYVGAIVLVTAMDGDPMYIAFGQQFSVFAEAVKEFRKVAWVKVFA